MQYLCQLEKQRPFAMHLILNDLPRSISLMEVAKMQSYATFQCAINFPCTSYTNMREYEDLYTSSP